MLTSYGFTVMIVEAKPKPSVKEHVEACVENCTCLICGEPAEKRGLCLPHYGQFRVALAGVAPSERYGFQQKLIRQGKLLPSRQGQQLDKKNVFREEAE